MLGLHALSEAPLADLGASSLSGQGASVATSATTSAGGRVQYASATVSASATNTSDSMRFRTSLIDLDAQATTSVIPNRIRIGECASEAEATLDITANFTAAGFATSSAATDTSLIPTRLRFVRAFSTNGSSSFIVDGKEKWEPIENDSVSWIEVS
jgi:hypothetical protein